jgi:CBS domain-containing protein
MVTVRQCLQSKGGEIWSTRPDISVYEALEMMAERDIGALLVLEGEKLVGIFSERDYARKVILQGKSSRDTWVSEIMTTWVVFVRPEQTIESAWHLTEKISATCRCWTASAGGVISIGDVVKAIISERSLSSHSLSITSPGALRYAAAVQPAPRAR